MKKRFVSVVLLVCFVLTAALSALGAMSLSNFERVRVYRGGFSDVSPSAWYYAGVRSAYERGILDGRSPEIFDPSGTLTLAETIKIAASLHKGYHTGSMEFASGSPWYRPYVDYALDNDFPVGAFRNYNAAATRADFALILAGALPDEAITPINRIDDGSIPDVYESFSYGQAVYKLYRAGVLTGSDSEGTFFPGRTLSRAEAASIIMRTVDANTRASLYLTTALTSEQIYKLASPAVFYVEVFDEDDTVVKSGSGFFISESGLAITNYHVVIGASSVKITTHDGEVLDVAGMYDFDRRHDAALIQVQGDGFPYLELADSSQVLTGATVYALGSPLGLQASFSRGIVSQALREVDGREFIQLDAAISSGSSGGALLDSSGKVVGVTSATMRGAQNINLAIPINAFAGLSRGAYSPLMSFVMPAAHYEGFFPAPDFGAFFDVRAFRTDTERGRTTFAYRLSDLPGDPEEIADEYEHLLEQHLFEYVSDLTRGEYTFKMYYNRKHEVMVTIGFEEVRGVECFTVGVS